jgi:predicted RNA-binding Zn-ribbon protein involved in translation (DUF1610 family)
MEKPSVHTDFIAVHDNILSMEKHQYCCKRFEAFANDNAIFRNRNRKAETIWKTIESIPLYYCPYCGKNIWRKCGISGSNSLKTKLHESNPCCSMMNRFIKREKIHYAYKYYQDIDETAWYASGQRRADSGHYYFCPFCGIGVRFRIDAHFSA